ncbi:protein kinase [Penicillium samsonianum]|uniref:protein kinase n=1 Tax=Penicillium samsonianum TaxID=1882272 RepID=UPI0025467654|nr:protein kinase [Penicillium samsonianum]KAJ6142860.1 protein kinase [Penicillium samsonianum]
MGQQLDDELNISKRCQGRHYVRTLLDSFEIDRASDKHLCHVHPPLWESVWAFLHRNPIGRLPPTVLTGVLRFLSLALDYLQTECKIIHTGFWPDTYISAGNIIIGIEDDSVFSEFEEREMQIPGPRKVVGPDGRTIYLCQDLRMPKRIGHPILCDLGSAVPGDIEHSEDIQPSFYRAPEVVLGVPWTYSVDIWNVGCMIWDIFEGAHLFTGYDPEFEQYRSRAHLADMINLLGPPPSSLLEQDKGSTAANSLLRNVSEPNYDQSFSCPNLLTIYECLDEFRARDLLKNHFPLEERETTLEGQDKV